MTMNGFLLAPDRLAPKLGVSGILVWEVGFQREPGQAPRAVERAACQVRAEKVVVIAKAPAR
jgi:hypothetical protein